MIEPSKMKETASRYSDENFKFRRLLKKYAEPKQTNPNHPKVFLIGDAFGFVVYLSEQ